MKVLHVHQIAGGGGGAGICLALHNALLARGHESAVLVGRRTRELAGVRVIEHDRYRSAWGQFWMAAAKWLNQYSGRIRGAQRVSERWVPRLASPRRFWSWWAGHEDFDFPGTVHLLEQAPFMPDVLHLHNLHGDYFDLRELPRLSRAVPTIITLHDPWLLAGHCSHSFDCERWKTGCGSCPRLDITPALRRDGTALNWQRKRKIYRSSRLSLVCPSQWLADKVRQSILMPGAARLKVIPNGVNTLVFKPGDKAAARERLGWPQEAFIVMFAANGVRQSIWKDYPTMREAIRLAGEKAGGRPLRFFAIGDTAPPEQAGAARIEFLPYRDSLAECYQAADVYLHAARADTFPTTIIEALACGVPVVATAVGGIPEQILDGETGFLVPAGDAPALAERLARLAQSPELVRAMAAAACRDATDRFSLERMVSDYALLYREVIEQRTGTHVY
jgi:glycosyltransferase involved in cell wall biosynthesis